MNVGMGYGFQIQTQFTGIIYTNVRIDKAVLELKYQRMRL